MNEMRDEIEKYYEKHHDIQRHRFQQVDWEATEKGLGTKQGTTFKKTLHNLRNTMTINKKWGKVDSDLCPLCADAPETTTHFYTCTHEDIVYTRASATKKILVKLSRLNASPDIKKH